MEHSRPSPPSLETQAHPLRVCDRCIRKKIKCNLARPTCSRCFDLGKTCTYSLVKRRPGPPRGSHWSRRRSRSRIPSVPPDGALTVQEPNLGNLSVRELTTPTDFVTHTPPTYAGSIQHISISPSCSGYLQFPSHQEKDLVRSFFDIAQDANPIFSKERFLRSYQDSLCDQGLVTTMAIVTAKLTKRHQGDRGLNLDEGLDSLLSSSLLEDDMVGDSPSLDQCRKAYILAFYEFHQFPGHHSWLRIGRVTRMAYQTGLDRLEHIRVLYPDWRTVSNDDMQEWRTLWWRIYRLDTYSNLASGTPYLVDDAAINTFFGLHQIDNGFQGHLLPSKLDGLSALLPTIISDPETLLDNIHNITTAIMRQAGIVVRMHMLRRRPSIQAQVAQVERHLTTLRLALPSGWLNPRRRAFANEAPFDYHARLITVTHLRMAQLLLAIVTCGHCQADEDWLPSWQLVLETCQDIAALAAQLDSSFCLNVDPAITFTIFTALIFFDLHRKSGSSLDDGLRSSIEHGMTVLHLQLKQFGNIWTQARLLALSFESFCESVSGPLSSGHIALILSRFEAPLHPRWLQFLASARPVLDAYQSY